MNDGLAHSTSRAFSLARQVPRSGPANLFGLRPGSIRQLSEVADDGGDIPVQCEEWQFFPHLDMTHTETSLHVDDRGPFIGDLAWPVVARALASSIEATTLRASKETGPSNASPGDWVISSKQLAAMSLESCTALIVFALPPDGHEAPPCPAYFTHEAMQRIVDADIEHLLFSEFSVDRSDDNGELHNHRMFWDRLTRRSTSTITENIARPNEFADGGYTLILNPMPAQTDASPSAPLLLQRDEWA